MIPTLADCWAKTDPGNGRPALTVRDHCLIVGAVAEALVRRLAAPLTPLLPQGIATITAAHDIGKIAPGFQNKCPLAALFDSTARNHESNHAKLGQAWFGTLADLRGFDGRAAAWCLSIGAHHGVYSPSVAELSKDLREEARRFPWAPQLRSELLDQLVSHFGPISNGELIRDSARVHWLTGFVTFADWIGSNSDWFKLLATEPLRDSWTPEQARERAEEAVEALGWHRRGVQPSLNFADLFGTLENGSPMIARPLQETLVAATDGPGLYLVEAPMGMGKTEAALAASYRRWTEGGERGLYFALPTQLTSNRIHERIASFLDRVVADQDSVQALVHGNAWLYPERIRPLQPTVAGADGDATDAHLWYASGRRALLAPFGTGTIDQALMSVMAAKHAALRLFALSGKAVVIDEVHSYDPYTSALVDKLVRHLLEVGCSVFILSATLTKRRRGELIAAAGAAVPAEMPEDYPLITRIRAAERIAEAIRVPGETPPEVTVALERSSPNDPDALDSILAAAEAGACVLVIRNTVRSAQETYLALKSLIRDGREVELGLLHSRFTFLDRQENEKLWMERLGRDGAYRPRHGAILVATQVVEQSVDIDADLLVTDLAPVDLVIQRLGRLHRHRRESRPTGYESPACRLWMNEVDWNGDEKTIKNALGPSAWVYPPFSLYQAERVFCSRKTLILPTEIRAVLEASDTVPENLPDGARRFSVSLNTRDRDMGLSAARQGWLDAATLDDREGTKTRWGSQDSGFIVLLASRPREREGRIHLVVASGKEFSLRTGEFSYELAKAMHENAIRVPRYAIRDAIPNQPRWISNHIEDAILAVVDEDNRELVLPSDNTPPFHFTYSRLLGLRIEKSKLGSFSFESEEDSWY